MASIGKPKSPDSEKNKRYDRQLRLWGDHGQALLENSHVCLINASATGTEVLKNLILPGIGAFTIIDDKEIAAEDVGNNFFLDRDSIGKSRAQVATRLLQELNSEVRGDFVEEAPEHLLEANPGFFRRFSVVVATGLAEKTLLSLSQVLWEANVPLLVCRSYGMIGYMRIQFQEHTVVEAHPDNQLYDLRLDKPFQTLLDFVNSQDLRLMDKKEHSHVPYLVIILKYLLEWQKKNNGQYPSTYKEKSSLKEMIKEAMFVDQDGTKVEDEENFQEAIKALNTALTKTKIPGPVAELFTDPSCVNLTTESKPFWILCHAVKQFVEEEGQGDLPLQGSIPDMISDSSRYIKLQTIYKEQAALHVKQVLARVRHLLTTLGKPQDLITEADVQLFCRNVRNLQVLRGRPLSLEYNSRTANIQQIVSCLDNPADNEMILYILLRAADRFYSQHSRYPGFFNHQVELDVVKLKGFLSKLLQELSVSPQNKDDFIYEMCRYGAAELHCIAAFVGGCAAQEVIKLITGQYVPFNNTYLYNAMTATSSTYLL